jgi:formate/nitrite transporter FocA (FNT family)
MDFMSERENIRHKVISTLLAIVALAIFCGILVVGAPQLFFG